MTGQGKQEEHASLRRWPGRAGAGLSAVEACTVGRPGRAPPRMTGVQRVVLTQMAAACGYQGRPVASHGMPARRVTPSHVAGPGSHA